MATPDAMSLTQLAFIIAGLPDRRELWTRFEEAAVAEYDRRVLLLEWAS